ncbi:MAG: polysaccharide pyruvyl transferase family protein [Parvularcula sp.]|jgi:succinoglycan biosynthesis protein ExoV|nr:polysaccharide pyruvyl transferase family protein [Parvularcula sp.]
MKPFYFSTTTNFGDHMNSWLWAELIPELLAEDDGIRLIGIGSLLARDLDLVVGRKVIFGTGSGYSNPPSPEQAAAWDVRCVRGPLTARLLGLDSRKAITDAAWLINRIPRFAKVPNAKSGTVFVPHWSSAAYGAWDEICAQAGLTYVDPHLDCETVFGAIATAELVIAESLHAAIIADYYRTPWIPVASPRRILTFKWLDWCGSLGLGYQPYMLPPSDYIDCLSQGIRPRQVVTDLHELSVDQNQYDIRRMNRAPRRHGLAFEIEKVARKAGRQGRASLLKGLAPLRDVAPFASWNAAHAAGMIDYFSALSAVRPSLSTDEVQSEKLDLLNSALFEMQRDYGKA